MYRLLRHGQSRLYTNIFWGVWWWFSWTEWDPSCLTIQVYHFKSKIDVWIIDSYHKRRVLFKEGQEVSRGSLSLSVLRGCEVDLLVYQKLSLPSCVFEHVMQMIVKHNDVAEITFNFSTPELSWCWCWVGFMELVTPKKYKLGAVLGPDYIGSNQHSCLRDKWTPYRLENAWR